jgi:orotate phosphoribosyltransferase-like protein
MQDRGELCLAEEVERLRQLGLSDEEVAGRLGVDVSWVESLVSPEHEETERQAYRQTVWGGPPPPPYMGCWRVMGPPIHRRRTIEPFLHYSSARPPRCLARKLSAAA